MAEQFSLESAVFENARKFHENYLLKAQDNDLQEAIQNYVEVLTLNPQYSECYYRLASLMYESGQITLESTIEQCQKAIELNPNNINAYIYAGYYLEQNQQYSLAEKIFRKAIKISKLKSARARLILASTIKKQFKSQNIALSNIIQYYYYLATGSLTLLADFSALKMMYKNAMDSSNFFSCRFLGKIFEKYNHSSAIAFYKKAIKLTQRKEYFYNKIAEIYLEDNHIEHALEYYKEALSVNPENKDTIAKLATLTQQYFPEKTDKIIDYYNMLLELEEDDLSPIYYELGHLYLQKNDKINSVSAFKLALNGNEDNPYYNDALAYAYVQAELFDDAIEYYQQAIKLNPDRSWTVNVCYSLGLVYQKCKENYEAAIASFQAGAILDPTNEQILLALGDVYAIQNELDLAIKLYEDVLTINPDNYQAYSKLGIIYWDKKNISQAINSYEMALKINPQHEITLNNLGVIYLEEIKDYELANDYFDKALDINPSYTYAYFNKGRCLEVLDNTKEAAKFYQMALDLNKITNSLDENEIQKRLYSLFNV